MRFSAVSIVSLVLLLSSFSPSLADLKDGDQALRTGDYARALKEFEQLAAKGEAKALAKLGQMYASGQGVAINRQKAVELFRKSAELGDAEGAFELGMAYSNGDGAPKSRTESATWLRHAADRGHSRAAYVLALMLLKGDGIPQMPVEGIMLMNQARSGKDMDAVLFERNQLDALGDRLKLRFEGGFGDSIESAVRIVGPTNSADGLVAEHKFVELLYPGWQNSKKSQLPRNDKLFDALELAGPQGQTETVYFDVTGWLGDSKN